MPGRSHSPSVRPPGRVRQPGRRAPWGTISRDQVVEAAVKAVRRDGYDRMTIRRLAADLDVSPMSLYRHVRDKDDLLDEVVDRLLARAWRPRADPAAWRAWVSEAADRLRQFLVSQPAALHVYLTHPVVSPAAIERMEAVLDVLRRAGFADEVARRAYAAIHTYTIGFAALEASRSGWQPSADTGAVAQRLAAFTTSRQFGEGLQYLLAGIEAAPAAKVAGVP